MKYTMEEIKKGEGIFTSGEITLIGEIMTIDDPRRFITYSNSELAGQDVEMVGSATMTKNGKINLTLI